MVFTKNWTMTEKDCPFHLKCYLKKKFPGFTETSFSTDLSARYLNCFFMVPRDWLDTSFSLLYRLVLLLSVLVFVIWGIFSTFSQTSYSFLYSSLLSWENTLSLIDALPRWISEQFFFFDLVYTILIFLNLLPN